MVQKKRTLRDFCILKECHFRNSLNELEEGLIECTTLTDDEKKKIYDHMKKILCDSKACEIPAIRYYEWLLQNGLLPKGLSLEQRQPKKGETIPEYIARERGYIKKP